MWALVILAVLSIGGVNAIAPSPAPATFPAMSPEMPVTPAPESMATDCMTLLLGMADCLSYVTKGSNVTKPDTPCCPELAGLLDTNPTCLCQLLGNSSDLPVPPLDLNRALKLPSICHLQTPPISMCSLIGIPVAAPAGSATLTQAPSSTSGMSPSPMGGEAEGPSSVKSGVSTSNTNYNLFYLISALTIALLKL